MTSLTPKIVDDHEPAVRSIDRTLDDICDVADDDRLFDRIDAKDFIHRYIGTLAPREERVLRLRFGLGGIGEHTLEEVGEMLCIGRGRTRQIEQNALRKLRKKSHLTWPGCRVQISDIVPKTSRKLPERRGCDPVSKVPLAPDIQPVLRNTPKGLIAADALRVRLYHQWQTEKHKALAKSRDIDIGTQEGNRALLKLLFATACTMLALVCFLAWGYTLNELGKEAFNLNFGRQDGPMVRLLVWLTGIVGTPLSAYFAKSAFEDWLDHNRLALP